MDPSWIRPAGCRPGRMDRCAVCCSSARLSSSWTSSSTRRSRRCCPPTWTTSGCRRRRRACCPPPTPPARWSPRCRLDSWPPGGPAANPARGPRAARPRQPGIRLRAPHRAAGPGPLRARGRGGAAWSGAITWLMVATAESRRGAVIGDVLAIAIAGTLLGPAVGVLAHAIGTKPVFSSVVVVAAVLSVLALRLPDSRARERVGVRETAHAIRRRPVLQATGLVMAPSVFFGVIAVLVPLRINSLGGGAGVVAAGFMAGAAFEAVLSAWVGRVSDRVGRLRPYVIGMVISAAGLAVLPASHALGVVVTLLIVMSVGAGLCFTPALALLSDAAEASGLHQGLAAGLINVAWAAGQVLGQRRRGCDRERRGRRAALPRRRRDAARRRVRGAAERHRAGTVCCAGMTGEEPAAPPPGEPPATPPTAEAGPPAERATIVVTDDLERSRLTVFFRLILVIPHLIVLALLSMLAIVDRDHQLVRDPVHAGRRWAHDMQVAVPALLHARRRLPEPRGQPVSRASRAAPGSYPIDIEIPPAAAAEPLEDRLPARAGRSRPDPWRARFGAAGGCRPAAATSASRSGMIAAAAFLGLVRLAGIGPHAARPARPVRLLPRVLGAGRPHTSCSSPTAIPTATRWRHDYGPSRPPTTRSASRADDDLRRSRLTVFFRFLLSLPHSSGWSSGAIAVVLRRHRELVRDPVRRAAGGRAPPFHRRLPALLDAHDSRTCISSPTRSPASSGAPGSYPVDLQIAAARAPEPLEDRLPADPRVPGADRRRRRSGTRSSSWRCSGGSSV